MIFRDAITNWMSEVAGGEQFQIQPDPRLRGHNEDLVENSCGSATRRGGKGRSTAVN